MKITAQTIASQNLGFNQKERIIYDEEIPGFGLRIRAGGSRTLVFTYKYGGMTRRIKLGNGLPEAFPAVRKRAAALYGQVCEGKDPAQERDDAKQRAQEDAANNFLTIAERFIADHGKKLRPRSLSETKRYLKVVAKPLHSRSVASIEKRDVASLLSAAASTRGPTAANRLQASLSKFFGWCMGEGLVEGNPVFGTNKRPETPRERILVNKKTGDVSELALVWHALDDGSVGGDIGKLLILTGCRNDEISALRWEEVDSDFTVITLPASRTKGKRERVIPLSEPAAAILKARPRIQGWPCVFSSSERGYKAMGTYKPTVDKRLSPEMAPWVWHDLRRTLDTGLGCLGVLPHVVDEIVGHKGSAKAGVRSTYNYALYLKDTSAALELWAEHLMAAVTGKSAKVVPLRNVVELGG
jgi:integrase